MKKRGYARLEIATAWNEILELGYGRRIHALPGVDPEDWQLAAQLAYRRDSADPSKAFERRDWGDVRFAESLQIFGGYAKAARKLGLRVENTGPVDL
eukprot:11283430-Heterocapsa_arctica.AAC.1